MLLICHPIDPPPVPPVIQPAPSHIQYFINDTAILPCDVLGNPQPTISWVKDGVAVEVDGVRVLHLDNGSLVIHNVSLDDAGVYRCLAVNTVGQDYVNITLNVTEPRKS